MAIQLTTDQEIELIEKYNSKLICPVCKKDKIHPDYLINKGTLYKLLTGFIAGIMFMICWWFLLQ